MSESLITYDQQHRVILHPSAFERREEVLATAGIVQTVCDASTQEFAVQALASIRDLMREVEKTRKAVKEPVLELIRNIDGTAKKFVEDMKAEEIRVVQLIGDYQQEQIAIARRKEAERQAELRRIEEERQAELQRIEEEQRKVAEEARRKAMEEAKAIKDADERKRREAMAAEEARCAAARLEAEKERQKELAAIAAEAVGPRIESEQAAGQRSKPVWDYEVTDIHLLYKMHPGFVKVEPRRSEIIDAIGRMATLKENGDIVAPEIKGLRVFDRVKTYTKPTRQLKAIDV